MDKQEETIVFFFAWAYVVYPDELAAFALLLASNLVLSITGTEIVIDGGAQPERISV